MGGGNGQKAATARARKLEEAEEPKGSQLKANAAALSIKVRRHPALQLVQLLYVAAAAQAGMAAQESFFTAAVCCLSDSVCKHGELVLQAACRQVSAALPACKNMSKFCLACRVRNVLKDHQENKHPKSTFEVSTQQSPVSMRM